MPERVGLGISVLEAARRRISWAFDTCPRVYVSFSGGKDSTVMLHLAAQEARSRGRRFGLLFVDLEGQYRLTIDHIQRCYDLYADVIDPYWVALPIHLRNAVSQYETHWICWEPGREADWVRTPPVLAIADQSHFPFYRYAMEFEEFVPAFGHWYAQGQLCACLVGIRTAESLNRWRTIAGHGTKWREDDGRHLGWTNYIGETLWNVYPIYDWRTEDLWTFHARYPDLPSNGLYDLMHKAGLTIHQMRICQPYGDDQRKGLWLFHLIEPETWGRIVARVNGANAGALYAEEAGNILGRLKITRPEGHTWESFARLLLESLPPRTREHFENKITMFLHWYRDRGYPNGIPDEADPKEEAARTAPSWRRVCKALLRNDYWCKGLSFSQHKSEAYTRYLKIMQKRRSQWGIHF
jgi:predicted phosphoadenosine phosphosulfate sulfurtransferase